MLSITVTVKKPVKKQTKPAKKKESYREGDNTSTLAQPPSNPIPWKFSRPIDGRTVIIDTEKTWYCARELACIILQCGKDEIQTIAVQGNPYVK